ncbi:MAG: hypothetical protein GEU98_24945 [Pseudonocardiaceae bacterium]|nr:hypothetical protein [Pseudonocardiaceae bacterium]
MSTDDDRRRLEAKRKSQADNAGKAANLRKKESRKRGEAAAAERAAKRTKNPSQAERKQKEVRRATEAAAKYGETAATLETKAAADAAAAARLQGTISKADSMESERAARKQAIAQRAAEREQRRTSQQIKATEQRVAATDAKADIALRALAAPKAEKLRILMLGASPGGDLRITREHTRIQRAIAASLHRDQVEIDVRLSATTNDLQEGIAKFRPHVVHFSGHGDEQLVGFEEDEDDFHEGVVVTAGAFASACEATDHPPTLIVFNACDSAETAEALVERFAPMAIGMTGSIEDGDALNYGAALYTSIANGHSVMSAHMAGKAAIELSGGEHELPYLAEAVNVNASGVILVKDPST